MATSSNWNILSFLWDDLLPGARIQIKLPQISQLVVLVVLASKDVKLLVVDGGRVRGTSNWSLDASVSSSEHLTVDSDTAWHELKDFIDS